MMFESDCLFISSDQLHSKNAPKSSTSTTRMVVVAHKNQKSFDRSTKRVLRSSKQIWASYVANDDDCCVSDACLLCGSGTNEASLHERLAKEFNSTGVCIPLKASSAINANRFNVDNREDGLNVVYINFDSLSLTSSDVSVSEMQTLLDSILVTLVEGKRALLHIKSDKISRSITSLLSDDTKKSSHQIRGKELISYIYTQEQAIIKSHLTGDLIRRLNKKNDSSNCPLTKYPARYFQNNNERKEMCRFHNYDKERGCLRSIKALQNKNLKGCDLDHDHCHQCGEKGHKAFECEHTIYDVKQSLVFEETDDGITAIPNDADDFDIPRNVPVPSLLVIGGRCRGRTLNNCEFLPLSSSGNSWESLPNLLEHRGSHAACAPRGCQSIFVMGGGGVDGNLDTVEFLDAKASHTSASDKEFKWHKMSENLSAARHAFGAVCVTRTGASNANEIDVDIFAVGGWMYGTKSCESMEKFSFKVSQGYNKIVWQNDSKWVKCSPIPTPRRLHSVAASVDGSSIFVFGGYIDERKVTNSIESYDIKTDTWSAPDELPYPEESCPLVQAVQDLSSGAKNSFIIFPYSDSNTTKEVLRYNPSCMTKFEPIVVPKQEGEEVEHLKMPIKNWHSFTATVSSSLQTVYVVGGLIDSKWTSRGFSLDLSTMSWQELPNMLLPRRRLAAVIIE